MHLNLWFHTTCRLRMSMEMARSHLDLCGATSCSHFQNSEVEMEMESFYYNTSIRIYFFRCDLGCHVDAGSAVTSRGRSGAQRCGAAVCEVLTRYDADNTANFFSSCAQGCSCRCGARRGGASGGLVGAQGGGGTTSTLPYILMTAAFRCLRG